MATLSEKIVQPVRPMRARMAKKKSLFLERFAETGNITQSARAAGIARTTIYLWLEHDDTFQSAFHDAEKQAIDVLDHACWTRAKDGVPIERSTYDRQGNLVAVEKRIEYSDSLAMFLLKSRDRAKYGDKVQSDSNVKIEGGYSDALA